MDTSSLDFALAVADWRLRVARIYATVRAATDPAGAHRQWVEARDELFASHAASPILDRASFTGLDVAPYDPALRFELELRAAAEPAQLSLATDGDHVTAMTRIGYVELPDPLNATLDVWWLEQYAGGLFLPVRDGSAGKTSYGGGRYALDTAKGADLGGSSGSLVLDLNFLYHPSCRYDPEWQCPLAPIGNTFSAPVLAGEQL